MLTDFYYPIEAVIIKDKPPIVHLAVFEHTLYDLCRSLVHVGLRHVDVPKQMFR